MSGCVANLFSPISVLKPNGSLNRMLTYKMQGYSIKMGARNSVRQTWVWNPALPFPAVWPCAKSLCLSESVSYLTQRGLPWEVGKELTIMWRKVFWLAHWYLIFVQKQNFHKCNFLNLQIQHMSWNWHSGLLIYLVLDRDPDQCHYSLVSQKAVIFWTSLETLPHGLWQVHLVHTKAHYFFLYYWTQHRVH